MTVQEAYKAGVNTLRDTPDAAFDAKTLLINILGIPATQFVRSLANEMHRDESRLYRRMVARRARGIPLQYILQEAWFMGLCFFVDERVLIPRQDTELLGEEALAFASKHGCTTALDLCTGSGALAVALCKLGGLHVVATDLSWDALEVAEKNADIQGAKIDFYQGDLFCALPKNTKVQLIVCNPPYLTEQDMHELQKEVRHEPALALLGGEDGLAFYRRLAKEASAYLVDGGALMMEIGCTQGAKVTQLFKGWKTEIKRDLNNLDRVVIAYKPDHREEASWLI